MTLTRKTPLKSGQPMKRTRIKPVSKKRAKERAAYLREVPHVGECERCGHTDVVERHHILPLARGGKLLDQFKWICRPCHRWIHANPKAAKEQGWMESGWEEITPERELP